MKYILVVVLFLYFAQGSVASPIKKVDDNKLLYLLSNLSLMKEVGGLENMESVGDLSFRMWIIPENIGECDGSPESYPKDRLLIVISTIEMASEQRLYEIPSKHGWVLSEIKNIPKTEDPNEYFVFKMIAKEPSGNPSKEWWKYVNYEIKVNLKKAMINNVGLSSEAEYNKALEDLYPKMKRFEK